MDNCLKVGAIVTSHGVHGEAKVFPTTDDARRYKQLKEVFLDTKKEIKTLHIEGVKFFKQFVIVKFEEFSTPEEVMKYKTMDLWVSRENAVKLKKDEYFIADLIGLGVKDENDSVLGKIEDVIQTGANDVYVIAMEDGRELLLPAIHECVLAVDIEEGFMKVHVLEGLLE